MSTTRKITSRAMAFTMVPLFALAATPAAFAATADEDTGSDDAIVNEDSTFDDGTGDSDDGTGDTTGDDGVGETDDATGDDVIDDTTGDDGSAATDDDVEVTIQDVAGNAQGFNIMDKDGKELASGAADNHSRAKIPFTPDPDRPNKLRSFNIQTKDGKLKFSAGQCTGDGQMPSPGHQGAQGVPMPSPEDIAKMATGAGVPVQPLVDAIQNGTITDLPELLTAANGGVVPDVKNIDDAINVLGGKDVVNGLTGLLGDGIGGGNPLDSLRGLADGLDIPAINPNLRNATDLIPVADTNGDGQPDAAVPMSRAAEAAALDENLPEPVADPAVPGLPDLPGGGLPGVGDNPLDADLGIGATTDIGAIADAVKSFGEAISSVADAAGTIAQSADGIAASGADAFENFSNSLDKAMDYGGPLTQQIYDDASVVGLQTVGDVRQQLFDIQTLNRNIANRIIDELDKDWSIEADEMGFTAQHGDRINCVVDTSQASGGDAKPAPAPGGMGGGTPAGATVDTGGQVKAPGFWERMKGLFAS